MTHAPRRHRYTFQEYLALELSSSPSRVFRGRDLRQGGTPEHAALAVGVSTALLNQLRGGPCRVHNSDLRVRVADTGLTTYPDVSVVCGAYETDPADENTVLDPRVIVEVTSESTEDYDRGEKLDDYRRIPGLDAIVLVAHREALIEVHERQPDTTWRRTEARRGGVIRLASLQCLLSVDEIYAAAHPA